MNSNKKIAVFSLSLIALGIILGAFGAHALKQIVTKPMVDSFETGVRYQLIGGLVVLVLVVLSEIKKIDLKLPNRLLLLGICFFSWSIYLLVFFKYYHLSPGVLFALTPIGGALMILGIVLSIFKVAKNWK